MNDVTVNEAKLTRVEVIDENGRSYVHHKDDFNITLSIQDDERTLKIFIASKFKVISGNKVAKLYKKKTYGNYVSIAGKYFYCEDLMVLYNFIKLAMSLGDNSPEWEFMPFTTIDDEGLETFIMKNIKIN